MSELDDLRSLIAVVETGGFARAGKSLGLAKSVVSRRVARLEEELGTRLLDRTTRGVGATEAGLAFKDKAERILADLAEARETVARSAEGVSGRLRLSMPLSFGIRHVAPILADLAKQHPKLEIDADASDRHVDLVAERFDAAIRIGQLKDSSLVARRIASVRVAIVGSPDYFARRGRPQKPQDLANHDGLIYTGSNQQEWRFGTGRSEITMRPAGRLRSGQRGYADAMGAGRAGDRGPPDLPDLRRDPQRQAGPCAQRLSDARGRALCRAPPGRLRPREGGGC